MPAVVLVVAVLALLWMAATVTGFVLSLVPITLMGLLTGWAASRLLGARLGIGWTILAGIAGSWLGGALFGMLHIAATGLLALPINLLAGMIGAAILITFARVVARPALPGSSPHRLNRF